MRLSRACSGNLSLLPHATSPKMPASVSGLACWMRSRMFCSATPHVLVDLAQVPPVAALGQLEAVVVGLGPSVFVVPRIRDALVEEQREDVRLEIRGVDGTPEAVGGRPEAAFQFLLTQRHLHLYRVRGTVRG